jgi:hypothetical protein
LCRSNKYAISINDSVSNDITDAANAALSKALPPPLTEYLQAFTIHCAANWLRYWIAHYQLKKKANEEVSDIIMQIATTGELNLGCIQPRALGNMFKSPSIC